MMNKPLCIYHGNCPDGFTAAWSVYRAFGKDVDFFAGIHNKPAPNVDGRTVIFVDFAYKRPIMEKLRTTANSILVLDHHISAMKDLDGIEGVDTVFDLNRSGAGIAWDWFHGVGTRPGIVSYVEDRDLWRFKLPNTKEILAMVDLYEYTFDDWDTLGAMDLNELVSDGKVVLKRYYKDLKDAIERSKRDMEIGGYVVPVVNVSHNMASDAGNILNIDKPFAASYYDAEDSRRFSLRSASDGLDVTLIAGMYDGGGHEHSSGFSVPRDHPLAMC